MKKQHALFCILLLFSVSCLLPSCTATPNTPPAATDTIAITGTPTDRIETPTAPVESDPATSENTAVTDAVTKAPATPEEVTTVDPEIDAQERLGMNMLQDPNFTYGFEILGMDSVIDGTTVYKTVKLGEEQPVWQVGQWWAKYDIKDGAEENTDARYALSDGHKSLVINKSTHGVKLSLDASQDIAQSSTTPPAKWPHFLLQQTIADCPLKGAESVTAKLAFTVEKAEDKRNGDGLHTQFSWFIYIVDTNPESEGYHNFLWFGLNLYCPPNRTTFSYSSQDMANGPGNFIYSLSSTDIAGKASELSGYTRGAVTLGEQASFELDLLPIVAEALAVAQSRGFMMGTTAEDCSITGMNIGYEIFDRWDVSISIDDIGIYRK